MTQYISLREVREEDGSVGSETVGDKMTDEGTLGEKIEGLYLTLVYYKLEFLNHRVQL